MLYNFYTNSEKAWQKMYESIKRARSSIYLEMYIFSDDMRQYNFIKLLKERAKEGIKVKIILDLWGSIELKKSSILGLRDAGVEVLIFSNFLHRMHRKIIVVDEEVAFIGGVNFKQRMRRWTDLVIKTDGKLVKNIARSFAKSYAIAGGKDEALVVMSEKAVSHRTRAWLIDNFPVTKNFRLKNIYKEAFKKAEKEIVLVTPYFIPRRWLMGWMHQAVLRGVRVEVLIPKYTDSFFFDRVNYFYIYKMLKRGITFYIEPRMNHAKAMIIDREKGMVGSNNLDRFSFDLNSEISVFTKDEKIVGKLLPIVEEWKRESALFDPSTEKPKWFDYILSPLIRLLFFR